MPIYLFISISICLEVYLDFPGNFPSCSECPQCSYTLRVCLPSKVHSCDPGLELVRTYFRASLVTSQFRQGKTLFLFIEHPQCSSSRESPISNRWVNDNIYQVQKQQKILLLFLESFPGVRSVLSHSVHESLSEPHPTTVDIIVLISMGSSEHKINKHILWYVVFYTY